MYSGYVMAKKKYIFNSACDYYLIFEMFCDMFKSKFKVLVTYLC